MTPTIPAVPDVPSTTPAWLVRLVALLVALAGPAIAWIDPTGKISTPAAQAIVILGFLIVAAFIFLVHLLLEGIHRWGLTKTMAINVESEAETELKALLPEMRTAYDTAKPVLDQLPAVGSITTDLAALHAKVDAIPPPAKVDIEALADELVAPVKDRIVASAVTATPAPAPAPVAANPAATGLAP